MDFEDVNTVMRNSGVAIMGSGIDEGDERARKAIQAALSSPLLEDNDIRGAQHILLNISSGTKEVTMEEITEITEHVLEEAGYGTDLIWGNCYDPSLGDKLMITLIATGFREGSSKEKEVKTPQQIKVSLNDDVPVYADEDYTVVDVSPAFDFDQDTSSSMNVIDFDTDDIQRTKEIIGIPVDQNGLRSKMKTEEKRKYDEMEAARRKNLRESNSKPLDNPSIISELENTPAYARRKVSLDEDVRQSGRMNSSYTVNMDDESGIQFSNNSYLFDNID
ncbi:MAG: hypothetical protein LC127_12185 [Chitinophagales bacterium]|nr:hypothetical protein [Chitinophagales bacterium]